MNRITAILIAFDLYLDSEIQLHCKDNFWGQEDEG